MVKPMNIPATKEEILEHFKKNSNGRPLNKDDYEIAEALSHITYKAYEVGMEDAKQLNMDELEKWQKSFSKPAATAKKGE